MIFYFYIVPMLLCLMVMKIKARQFSSEEVFTSIIPVFNIICLIDLTVGLTANQYDSTMKWVTTITNWINKK